MFNQNKAELANTITHGISLLIFCMLSVFLFIKAVPHHSTPLLVGLILFYFAEILMFGSSTLYHFAKDPEQKRNLRYLDHCAIYVSIAGSYSPILLWSVGGTLGIVFFIIIWALTVAGIFYKIFALGKHPKLSLALYLAMGWMVVFIAKPVFEAFPAVSLWLLLAEGIAFSLGTIFFWRDEKHTYNHAIWHIFILIGCLCHTAVLWFLM